MSPDRRGCDDNPEKQGRTEKHVKQKYRMVIGQADLLTQEQVEKFKKEQGICLYSRKGGADTNGENIGIS